MNKSDDPVFGESVALRTIHEVTPDGIRSVSEMLSSEVSKAIVGSFASYDPLHNINWVKRFQFEAQLKSGYRTETKEVSHYFNTVDDIEEAVSISRQLELEGWNFEGYDSEDAELLFRKQVPLTQQEIEERKAYLNNGEQS